MNVKELREWLDWFDDDVTVECVVHSGADGYYQQGGTARVEEFAPDMADSEILYCHNGHMEYSDFTNNPFMKESNRYYGKKVLTIGSLNN